MAIPPTITRAGDGSVGQVYTTSTAGQWVARDSAGTVADISGQTGTTYTAQAGDTGKRLGVRLASGAIGYALNIVYDAPILLDAMDTLTSHATVGTSTTLALNTPRKVQGVSAIQVDAIAATTTAGVDFTGASMTPSTLDVISVSVDRLTEANITAWQIFMHSGATNGNISIGNDQSQLPGQRWLSFHASEIPAFYAAAAAAIRMRNCMNKGSSLAASAVFDAGCAKAGGRPTILLSFDDGYKTIRDVAYPELNNRGLKATVYPAPSLLNAGTGDFAFMSTAEVQFLHAQGWDIGCDGSMDDTAVSTDPTTAATNINLVRAWVEANVGNRASAFACWPFGNPQSDAVAAAVIASGFKMVRGTQLPGHFHSRFGISAPLQKKYPSQGISTTTLPSDITALIDQAILRGATLSIHMHSFTESTGNAIFIPSSAYTPILDYVQTKKNAGAVDVLTISELWARDSGASFPA